MVPLIPALALLAVQQGPAMIRGISNLLGGNDTANKLSCSVEQVSGIGLTTVQQQAAIEEQLNCITNPTELADLQKIRLEMEKEATRRMELKISDQHAEQVATQQTIRDGDQNDDEYVRRTRPLMARQSWNAGVCYIFLLTILKAFNYGSGPDFEMAILILSPAWAYLGLRTLDGFAPHPKSSGQKVGAASINNLLQRAR